MLFGIYVDDLLVTGTNNQRVDDFFSRMACLKSKDLSLAEKSLGMSYHFDETFGYQVDQEVTIRELLHKHGLDKAEPVLCPIRGEYLGEYQPRGGV